MSDLIEALGGPAKVAAELGYKRPRVANWQSRGVPWRERPKLARLARQKSVDVPAEFLEGEAA